MKIRSRNWFKTEIKLKLNLIYNWELKSNAKWWKIQMKTRNLTQSRARNDPINRRMHGYSFRNFEDEDGIQDVISNTPRRRKRVKKVKKSKEYKIVVSRQFDFTRKSKGSISVAKNSWIYRGIGRKRQIQWLIAINGWDDAPIDESSWLIRVRPITDEASGCFHVARRREASIHRVRWTSIWR